MNKKINIIFLNGVGSVGKTSIANALQDIVEEPYLHIGVDHFFIMLPKKYLPGGSQAIDGVDFITEESEEGPIIRVHCGDVGKELFASMKKSMLGLAKDGFNLIIDEVILGDEFEEYKNLFKEIKAKVLSSQLKASIAVNSELIKLYWEIGNAVCRRQQKEGWGSKIIEKLAKDLKLTFPDMKGFSLRNIQFMVQFAKKYLQIEIVKQLVSQIPWGHNILIMQRLSNNKERFWYIKQTIENGWSRSILENWIDSNLYLRQGKAATNFKNTLPATQSDLANQIIKDPYCFDFLTLRKKYDEKELECGLMDHIQKFLLELGAGFAFVGRQYQLTVSNKDFFVDLLFYHLKLRSFIVVELKAKAFTPKDVGQMNFYLSVIDDLLRQSGDNPTMGLLLCKTKDKVIAEYALRDIHKPIGISEYKTKIIESLPENLKGSLPTIEEIEEELSDKNQ